ncbi:MAG: hypothetical protein FJ255_01315 [Phycisphaerae bacterium]|nr:hypothetical protein [Phycisphaerae bacterium]
MKTVLYSAACCAALTLHAGARAQSPGAELRILGMLPDYPRGAGFALSDDAGVIVGMVANSDVTRFHGVRWDSKGRLSLMPGEPERPTKPNNVSPDGRLIVGWAVPPGTSIAHPALWRDGVLEVLPMLPNSWQGIPEAISDDGRVIVGDAKLPHTSPYSGLVRWVDGKVEDLSRTPGEATPFSGADVDAVGRYIVGGGFAGFIRATRVDTLQRYVRDLGNLPGVAGGDYDAPGIDGTGLRVVGSGASLNSPTSGEAFLWSAPTGMVGLGTPPYFPYCSGASAIARRLPVVAGEDCTRDSYFYLAFLWDPVRGKRYVNDILDALGVDRRGYTINNINDISPDGTLMTGIARRGFTDDRPAFLVRLPPWCWADCTGDDVVDFSDLLCFLNRFERAQDPRANPIDFFYCDLAPDDEIDFNDFLAFLNLYNKGCGE